MILKQIKPSLLILPILLLICMPLICSEDEYSPTTPYDSPQHKMIEPDLFSSSEEKTIQDLKRSRSPSPQQQTLDIYALTRNFYQRLTQEARTLLVQFCHATHISTTEFKTAIDSLTPNLQFDIINLKLLHQKPIETFLWKNSLDHIFVQYHEVECTEYPRTILEIQNTTLHVYPRFHQLSQIEQKIKLQRIAHHIQNQDNLYLKIMDLILDSIKEDKETFNAAENAGKLYASFCKKRTAVQTLLDLKTEFQEKKETNTQNLLEKTLTEFKQEKTTNLIDYIQELEHAFLQIDRHQQTQQPLTIENIHKKEMFEITLQSCATREPKHEQHTNQRK